MDADTTGREEVVERSLMGAGKRRSSAAWHRHLFYESDINRLHSYIILGEAQ